MKTYQIVTVLIVGILVIRHLLFKNRTEGDHLLRKYYHHEGKISQCITSAEMMKYLKTVEKKSDVLSTQLNPWYIRLANIFSSNYYYLAKIIYQNGDKVVIHRFRP